MTFRYIQLIITKTRSGNSGMQFSELNLLHDNSAYTWPADVTITANKPPYAAGESVDKVIDGNTNTKYYTASTPSDNDPIIITIDTHTTLNTNYYNAWNWYTANDTDGRDPVSFIFQVSADGVNYNILDSATDANITTSRKVLAYTGELIAIESYTISFNANGGAGTMSDQTANIDEYTHLDICQFSKSGFMFIGWALTASGAVVYSDGAEVLNLAGAGETITLYAVWETETLRCIIQNNKSEANRAVKDLTDIRSSNFVLKDPTSIIDPVLILACDITDIIEANYLTVPIFRRSYFIIDIISVRKGLTEIHAHVDVLSSYIEQLKTCEAVIHRQENQWNLYLDDGIFKTYQNPRIGVTAFPSGFSTQNFVLAVAGD